MSFNMADTKRKARQVLHGLASVSATYTGPEVGAEVVPITVRWHNKIARPIGDLENTGYAEILSGVDRLIFSASELGDLAVNLERNGTVVIPEYDNYTFTLDLKEPGDGPENVYWSVSRE